MVVKNDREALRSRPYKGAKFPVVNSLPREHGLTSNPAVEQWLATRHPEILSGFRSIISVASLDEAVEEGDDEETMPSDDGLVAGGASFWAKPSLNAGVSDPP